MHTTTQSTLNLTKQQAAELLASKQYDLVPLACELYADAYTPINVLRILQSVSNHCYLLESVENAQKWSRYTFLGYDPSLEITCTKGTLTITEGDKTQTRKTTDPSIEIRDILAHHKSVRLAGMPPFTGGLVGYFSYDYLAYAEPTLRLDAPDEEGFKDVDLMLFDKLIAFDNFRQKIILIANVYAQDFDASYDRALDSLVAMKTLLETGTPRPIEPGKITSDFRALKDESAYCSMVEQAKRHIFEGDIFQVVLSNRLDADFEGSLLDTYRVLRTTNPSPYMFYFSSDDIELAGASPETLVKLEGTTLHTFPLAGT